MASPLGSIIAFRSQAVHDDCPDLICFMAKAMSDYQLLDFGDGRRLERFGQRILDRPSPAAEGVARQRPELWSEADLKFTLEAEHRGFWCGRAGQDLQRGANWRDAAGVSWIRYPQDEDIQWMCDLDFGRFLLKATDFGHIGLFPEHFPLWQQVTQYLTEPAGQRILSLFAYTGGSSICLARSGAQVTHVEAARNVVAWARQNARSSHADELPIRWLCEDVKVYVRREAKRQSFYDGLILDPPTYGHGPKGQVWKVQRDLPLLLEQLAMLASPQLKFVLLTVHSSDYQIASLRRLFRERFLARWGAAEHRTNGTTICESNQIACPGHPRGGLDTGIRLLWHR